jgi:trimeric autotransporter adhesin
MYEKINPTQMFRERQLALLEEASNRRIVRRLRAGRAPKARSGMAAFLLAALVIVVGTMLVALSSPAHSSTTFTVNSAADLADVNGGDGICDADAAVGNLCTLRAAINEANVTTDADTIDFNIPGTGVKTISPNTVLPNIIHPVSIDGFTQPGAVPNTLSKDTNAKLMIELNGSGVTGTSERIGLRLAAPDSEVRGLVINRFTAGIAIFADGVRLSQNFIGTDPTGTQDLGNSSMGIFDQGFGSSIGTPRSDAGANLISGNDGAGIAIRDLASHTQVAHNLIGTDKSGTKKLGNSKEGVEITNSSNNSLDSNTIAFNGGNGVKINDTSGSRTSSISSNSIFSNAIFSNAGLGIDLAGGEATPAPGPIGIATTNDLQDVDSGPNGLQNFPVLSSAKTVSGKTTIKGKLNSSPNESYTIQFFSNPSGNEGKKLIGQKSITTDVTGNRAFTFSTKKAVRVRQKITATATRDSTLDTSEFSSARKVTSS